MNTTNKTQKGTNNDCYTLLPALFSCKVCWDELNDNDESDLEDKRLFEKSILGYVNAFNLLPQIGFMIDNGNCDPGKIENIYFNGINNSIYVYLSF